MTTGTSMPTTPTACHGTVLLLYGYLMESSSQKNPRWKGRTSPNSNTRVGMNTTVQMHSINQSINQSWLSSTWAQTMYLVHVRIIYAKQAKHIESYAQKYQQGYNCVTVSILLTTIVKD